MNHKQKYNTNLNLWHEVNTKKLEYLRLITNKNRGLIQNPAQMVKKKLEFEYLNSMTTLILPSIIYFVGSWLKILRMSWYRCMASFRDNFQLFIKNLFCHCHNSLSVIYYNPNKELLSVINKKIFLTRTFIFELAINFLLKRYL